MKSTKVHFVKKKKKKKKQGGGGGGGGGCYIFLSMLISADIFNGYG